MEAAAIACLSIDQTVPSKVDVFACSSTLGNLRRFIDGEDKPFRILIELVHGTMFLIRRENSPHETIPGVVGYGHTFPEAYTTWEADVRNSLSHHRVLRYNFGGLNLLVRFEANGYIPGSDGRTSMAKPTDIKPRVDRLSDVLSDSKIAATETRARSQLFASNGGTGVDQSTVFDIKTRSQRKIDEDVLGKELPGMWVAQIPTFVLAFHDRGCFKDIRVMDIQQNVKRWEEEHRDDLACLAALTHKIIELVSAQEDGKIELCYSGSGALEVRTQLPDVGEALSAKTRELWLKGRARVMSNDPTNHDKSVESDSDGGEDSVEDLIWVGQSVARDDDEVPDFTACSAEHCGYCGKCSY